MNKRAFLKISSAAMASPILSPLLRAMPAEKLTNWAGNLQYGTDRLYSAASVEQAREYVKRTSKLKVLGTRHCFNTIANSTDDLLSLRPAMEKVISLDVAARTVTIEAGMSYGQLAPILEQKGFALHNLASLPHISVAGATCTGTHGSGDKNGNLATAVNALEFVTATGDVLQLSRATDGETFRGAVVGLGALGVITKVSLDLQPTFKARQYVYENLSFKAWTEHFETIESSAYSVSLFTDWQKDLFSEVWLKQRLPEGGSLTEAPAEFFGAKLFNRDVHPIITLNAENCTPQMGVPGPWYERLPHFKMGFTPSAGKELQTEYFVPRPNAVDAVLAVKRLSDQITPHLMISEIRTIAADDLWMSPCYKQDCVAIHFTWQQDWPAVRQVLPLIEKELASYKAHPHWGKLFTMQPQQLHASYEKLPDFIALCKRCDPQGKFRNEFLNTYVFT